MRRLLVLGVVLGLSCGEPAEQTVTAMFTLPDAETPFFDLPWPNDLRRTEAGTIDVMAYPNPRSVDVYEDYLVAITDRVTGYSVSAPAYLRFDGAIDESSLPQSPEESVADGATAFLFDVERGEKHPAVMHYWDPETTYWPGHTLAIRPVYGLVLRGGATYAAVVTRDLRAADGGGVGPSEDFRDVRGGNGDAEAVALYEPAFLSLEAAGISRNQVASMAVFTTQDPTAELMRTRDWFVEQPAPEANPDRWRFIGMEEDYLEVEGAYESPTFQAGEIPYTSNGGDFQFDASGDPILQGTFDQRFSMRIPRTPMPADGYPIVLYAHGTGGNYQSYQGSMTNALTRAGYAVMGIDQLHHGERNPTGGGEEVLTFNFFNPMAFRDNARQAAMDVVAQARFVATQPVSQRTVNVDPPISFDADRIYFFGHSQGGLNGPLFLAIDDHAKGGVLSGAGGHLPIALVDKVEPLDIPGIVRLFLRVSSPEAEHLVYEHPVFALLQTWTDVADPTNYVQHIFDAPREGFAPKSLLQTEGLTDDFTPPRSQEALSTAARLPQLDPMLSEIESLSVAGVTPQTRPVTANVAGGMATGGVIQWDGGHFVAFRDDAEAIIVSYFESFADGVPTIP